MAVTIEGPERPGVMTIRFRNGRECEVIAKGIGTIFSWDDDASMEGCTCEVQVTGVEEVELADDSGTEWKYWEMRRSNGG